MSKLPAMTPPNSGCVTSTPEVDHRHEHLVALGETMCVRQTELAERVLRWIACILSPTAFDRSSGCTCLIVTSARVRTTVETERRSGITPEKDGRVGELTDAAIRSASD